MCVRAPCVWDLEKKGTESATETRRECARQCTERPSQAPQSGLVLLQVTLTCCNKVQLCGTNALSSTLCLRSTTDDEHFENHRPNTMGDKSEVNWQLFLLKSTCRQSLICSKKDRLPNCKSLCCNLDSRRTIPASIFVYFFLSKNLSRRKYR